MNYYIDAAVQQIKKFGEELCGDSVEIVKTDKEIIIVMADGLGSGVKANILSTLTSKIAVTMVKGGAGIYETVDTITNTLPVCNIRKLAYSTFSIISIKYDGTSYVLEYDNPSFFIINGNDKKIPIAKRELNINNKIVHESTFNLEDGDSIIFVSDGVIHAGIGKSLNLGWKYDNIKKYLNLMARREKNAENICKNVIEVCNRLYKSEPGDDSTVIAVKIKKQEIINLFTGPPVDKNKDKYVIDKLMKSKGRKVICGGTAGTIAERILKKEIEVDLTTMTAIMPPIGRIDGIDLLTEGVITLSRALEILKRIYKEGLNKNLTKILDENNGASMLAKILYEHCTQLNLIVGKVINPAHQNPNLPVDLSIKLKVVKDIYYIMSKLGKKVNIEYVE